jgi:amino acid adenylation domain-containing protein
VSILGVLKSGGAYVPIDLAYPKERLGFMLEDSQAPVLLTQQKLREAIPQTNAKVLCLDSDECRVSSVAEPMTEEAPRCTLHAPRSTHQPSQAAYIIYTSGSTGKPKGVIVTHHNVVRLLKQTEPWYQFNCSDVWPLFHSYAFDVSVWELWGSLFYGGRLVIVPYLVTRSPADFYELLAKEKVTVLNQTPSAFRQLIWAETTAQTKRQLSLRYVICAGEALELQSLKPWFEVHGDEKPLVVNMYGITETTVHSTYRPIRKSDLESGAGSVIGVPIPDLQIHLVDEDLKPVPRGVPGEICVGGAGVARGYLNRPELTSRRFLADPFSDQPGAKLYRSGDLAQYSATGELEYLGRMDHQVKIRGFRVELGEIESALNRHPAIRESVVLARETPNGEKRLIAYIVPVGSAPTTTELRQYLGEHIPEYMIPAAFISLKSLPLNTNGKVDRRALPAPERARPDLANEFVPPRTANEQALAAIWSEVLEVEPVGAQDNFFELGGDSIRSIRVLSKAREQGLNVSLEHIFQFPTVAGLTACAEKSAHKGSNRTTSPFALISGEDRAKLPQDIEDAYPLTRLQMGMFFSNDLDPSSAIYHDIFSYRIQSVFEQPALEEALQRLVQRHPILRTSFHLAGFSQPL